MAEAKRWEKFIQPLRDLADLWSVDIEKDLLAYLGDLQRATLEVSGQPINFAEAAVLVQNSAQYYSKKVEQLAVLVYLVLERITQSKRRESQGEGGTAGDNELPEINTFEPDALQDLFAGLQPTNPHLLHDFLRTNDGTLRRPTRSALATCDCMPFEDFEKAEKNHRLRVAELSDRCCILVNPDSAFLVSNQPTSSSVVSLDVSHIPPAGNMQSLDSSQGLRDVHQDLCMVLQSKEEARSAISSLSDRGDFCDGLEVEGPVFGDDAEAPAPGAPPPDPFLDLLGDPYETAPNVNQPLVKGSHDRRVKVGAPHLFLEFMDTTPDSAFDTGYLTSAQVPNNEPIRSRKPLHMSSFEDMRLADLKRRRKLAREQSERNREEEDHQLRSLMPVDVDADTRPFKTEPICLDDDFDDNVSDEFAELPPPMAEPSMTSGLFSPTQTDKWVEEAVQQMSQYQQMSAAEVEVHERVSHWTKRMEPLLLTQERGEHEKPFKLDHYAHCIMQHFKTSKLVNFVDVVVADSYTDDRTVHVARTFLASLQLANDGNVALEHENGLVSASAPLYLRFLMEQQALPLSDPAAPITDISNTRSPPASSPMDARPPKRRKAGP